jgi:hypothetical protein
MLLMEDRLRPMKPWCVAGKPPCIDVNFSVVFIREFKRREKVREIILHLKGDFVSFRSVLKINFGLQTETGDQVIGIHSASELETQLNDTSMASLLAILFFSETYPCRYVSLLYTNTRNASLLAILGSTRKSFSFLES